MGGLAVRLAGFPQGSRAVDLAAGLSHTCARLSNGSVSCWGDNSSGQYGDGTRTRTFIPEPAPSKVDPTVVALAAGTFHTCAILGNGTVSCWGLDDYGQLGDGQSGAFLWNPSSGPPVPGVANALEITAGIDFTCALVAGGTIRCWGANRSGQHGNLSTAPSGTDSVSGIAGTFLAVGVTAGNGLTCALRGTGTPACRGAGTQGQLGNSSNATSANPVAVTGIDNALAVSAGNGAHNCALDARGIAQCWGSNRNGQLGNGTTVNGNPPRSSV
jgi:alpha-tubulin suppressor-like RCC1 family protein